MDMEQEDPIRDGELLRHLDQLRKADLAAFMQLVLDSLKHSEEYAVQDKSPTQNKVRAINYLIEYFEKEERFEDCAFLRDLKQKIEDEKNKVPSAS